MKDVIHKEIFYWIHLKKVNIVIENTMLFLLIPMQVKRNHTAKIPGATNVGLIYRVSCLRTAVIILTCKWVERFQSTSESGTISISHIPCMEYLKKGKHWNLIKNYSEISSAVYLYTRTVFLELDNDVWTSNPRIAGWGIKGIERHTSQKLLSLKNTALG